MTTNLSFPQLFLSLFILFATLLASSILFAWSGPTAAPPGANVAAPINVGTTDQVKNSGLSVNALSVFGRSYIQSGLNVGSTTANQVAALYVNGTVKIGNGGEVCQAVTEGAQRYNSTTGVMEYCNGVDDWIAVGSGGGGGAGKLPPTNFPDVLTCGTDYVMKGKYSGTSVWYGLAEYNTTSGVRVSYDGITAAMCPSNISGAPGYSF